jgi:hypothetical protein
MNRSLLVLLLLVAAGVAWRFHLPQRAVAEIDVARDVSKRPAPKITVDTDSFSCEGKTRCRQMTSCAEAKFYLDHCPGVQIDGDNDGIPCESQWCDAD